MDTKFRCFMEAEVVMRRRKVSRAFKIEAVRLVRERGVSAAQAARDLDVHENLLRKWVKEFGSDPVQAFPGHGQMKPEQLEVERLRREVAKLKAERDILKKAAAYFAREVTRRSLSSRSIGASGRWHGCAVRWMCPVPASMPGSTGAPAPGPDTTRLSLSRSTGASRAATAPTAHAGSGTMSWQKGCSAAYIASNG